jgi:hypothetical protein
VTDSWEERETREKSEKSGLCTCALISQVSATSAAQTQTGQSKLKGFWVDGTGGTGDGDGDSQFSSSHYVVVPDPSAFTFSKARPEKETREGRTDCTEYENLRQQLDHYGKTRRERSTRQDTIQYALYTQHIQYTDWTIHILYNTYTVQYVYCTIYTLYNTYTHLVPPTNASPPCRTQRLHRRLTNQRASGEWEEVGQDRSLGGGWGSRRSCGR